MVKMPEDYVEEFNLGDPTIITQSEKSDRLPAIEIGINPSLMYSDDVDLPKNISLRKKDALTVPFIPLAAHSFIGKSTETLLEGNVTPEKKQVIFQTEARKVH